MQKINHIISQVLNHQIDVTALHNLTLSEKYNVIKTLLNTQAHHQTLTASIVLCTSQLIPDLPQGERLRTLQKIIDFACHDAAFLSSHAFRFLTPKVLNSILAQEKYTLVQSLKGRLLDVTNINYGLMLWGIGKVLPFLHHIKQKEVVQDLFELSQDSWLEKDILQTAAEWIYSLKRENRLDHVMFCAANLTHQQSSIQVFTMSFLQLACPALNKEEYANVIDFAEPLVNTEHIPLLKKWIMFLEQIIPRAPQKHRFYYIKKLFNVLQHSSIQDFAKQRLKELSLLLNDPNEKSLFIKSLQELT